MALGSGQEFRSSLQKQIQTQIDEINELDEFMELAFLSRPDSCSQKRKYGGSRPRKRGNLQRKREEGHQRIWEDYFADDSIYTDQDFRRRYRMTRRLFDRIMHDVCAHDDYFVQKGDAAGKLGLSPLQKLTSALYQLALGICGDATDEYCKLAESTALNCLYRFVIAIRELYEHQYLRKPSGEDFKRQLQLNKARGFPGMFDSLDCMHYVWKNCLVAWQGQFTDKDDERSIILERTSDQELWIWHAFFGLPRGNNDLNVLDRSPLVDDWLHNGSDEVQFTVNGTTYHRPYLLVDYLPRLVNFYFYNPHASNR